DRVGGDAAAVPVPPGLVLVLPPERLDVRRVLADQVVGHALDDRFRREVRLRIADRDRLDRVDAHQEIAPWYSGMPATPTSTLSSCPFIGVASGSVVSVVPKSQT